MDEKYGVPKPRPESESENSGSQSKWALRSTQNWSGTVRRTYGSIAYRTLRPEKYKSGYGRKTFWRIFGMSEELETGLNEDEAAKLIIEVEEVIEAIKNGEIEGEYFEF